MPWRAFVTVALSIPATSLGALQKTTGSIPLAATAQSTAHAKASAKDSLYAQRMVWDPLHFLYRRPRELIPQARARVRAAYAKWSPTIPGDDWLAGLRISFPMPGGKMSTTLPGLPDCQASEWWCEMIYTFILWRNNRFVDAQLMLQNAQAHMTPQIRCVWGDVSMLIDIAKERARYEKLGCAERAAFEERLWWLADPLFSESGNERMMDHYARAVNLRLATEQSIPHVDGYPWALRATRNATQQFSAAHVGLEDMNPAASAIGSQSKAFKGPEGFLAVASRLMLEANYFSANLSSIERAMQHRIVGGPAPKGIAAQQQFVPAFAALQSPFQALPQDWNLSPQVRRESGRSPVGPMVALEAQHAFFARGDSARLVVVSEPARTSLLAGALTRAALAYMRSPRDSAVIHRIGGRTRYEFSPTVPADSMVVSLEVLAIERGAGRVRWGAAPPWRATDALRLSDLLLLGTGSTGESPTDLSLDSAIARALPTTTISRTSKPGVYWETYGTEAGAVPEFEIRMERVQSPRATPNVSAKGGTAATSLNQWAGRISAGGAIEPGQIVLDVSTLEPGYYRLSLRVVVSGKVATTARTVLLR